MALTPVLIYGFHIINTLKRNSVHERYIRYSEANELEHINLHKICESVRYYLVPGT